jgi:hypothetical protein
VVPVGSGARSLRRAITDQGGTISLELNEVFDIPKREDCQGREKSSRVVGVSSSDWSTMSMNLMKSLRFSEFGPPSVLRIEEVAIPEAGGGKHSFA